MSPICPACSNIVLMITTYRARCFECNREYLVKFKDIYNPKRRRIYKLEEIVPVSKPVQRAATQQENVLIYEEYYEPPPLAQRREERRGPSWQDDLRM